MRKFGVYTGTIFISILVSSVYGFLHDQITYSISPEYFTKFKFHQFGFEPSLFGGYRQTVGVIGFLATWWVGLIIGLLLATISLIFNNHTNMRKALSVAIGIVFSTAILFAVIGYFRGKYYLIETGVSWWLPDNLIDRNSFIIVGSIHNYSYLGGLIGLIIAMIYLVRKNISIRKLTN